MPDARRNNTNSPDDLQRRRPSSSTSIGTNSTGTAVIAANSEAGITASPHSAMRCPASALKSRAGAPNARTLSIQVSLRADAAIPGPPENHSDSTPSGVNDAKAGPSLATNPVSHARAPNSARSPHTSNPSASANAKARATRS
jgi:hypothetical protein